MEDLNGRQSQMQAAFCMGFVFIFVGVPIWWKTTTVYRADLPYTRIQQLAERPQLFTDIRIKIAAESDSLTAAAFDAFGNLKLPSNLTFISVTYSFQTGTFYKRRPGEVVFGECDSTCDIFVSIRLLVGGEKERIVLGKNRSILVEIADGSRLEDAANAVMKVVTDSVVNIEAINDAMGRAYGAKLDFSKDRELHIRKTVQPNKGYDLIFSLICPEPHKLQASWEIEEAVELYLNPTIAKLGSYAEFHIGSQVLYYSGLSVKPKRKTEKNTTNFYLTPQQLPHVINPIESRLGAEMSPNPTLNFIVYMTEEKHHPLYIEREDGTYSTTNSFLVPRWGTIFLKNTERNSSELPRKVGLSSVEFMEVFLAQFRLLLGIEGIPELEGFEVQMQDPDASNIRDLELDYLVRVRSAENIAMSIHTLNSLAQLLEKIQNIVINDKIAEHVYSSVNALHKAINALQSSSLQEAILFSNLAFKASETAFFDPTLLELLYFPEDQKFAIYIPLFLPISLPLLVSFANAIKLWNAERKKSKQKGD